VLVLEGAEDFDVIEGATATTVQVKDTRKRLSLRSRTVLDALANYLETVQRNPTRRVRYRLLTTAVVTTEKGSPFGKGVPGLHLWEETQRTRDLDAALSIAEFLKQGRVRESLRAFLRRASASSVLTDLIQLVSWETGSRELGFVERAVTDILIDHGATEGVPPGESKKVVGRLLHEALRFLTKPDRPPLTRPQFAEIFEEETSERVSYPELRRMRRAIELIPTLARDQEDDATPTFSVATVERVSRETPILSFEPLPRPSLIKSLRETLVGHGSLALLGSTGTGKTLLAREIALQSEASLVWTSFVDCDETDLPLVLRQIRLAKRETSRPGIFVFDDVNLSGQRHSWDRVATLLFEVLAGGHNVLVTTARPIPATISRRLGRMAPKEKRVPSFVAADVQSFALLHGCPEATASAWSGVILSRTGGHPQLVHALVDGLTRREWPAPGPDDLLVEPTDLQRERSEARQILARHLPSTERDFVYALSLYGYRFRRDQALALGSLAGIELTSPGDCLDQLLGPWIEQVSRSYLRLSPLLSDAAREAWSAEKIGQMRLRIVEAILRTGNLGLHEASSLLLHATIGRFDRHLSGLCVSLLSLPGEAQEKIAESLGWLAAVDLGPLLDDGLTWQPWTLLVLRTLQYRIASFSQPSLCPKIIDRWDHEIGRLTEPVVAAFHEFALAGEVVTRYEAPITAERVLTSLIRLERLRDRGPQPVRDLASDMAEGVFATAGSERGSILSSGFLLVAHHCRNAQSVIDFIRSLSSLDADLRREVLAGYYRNNRGSALFVSQAWTPEIDKDSPDWSLARKALLKAVHYGRRWETPPIAVAGYTGLAAVHAEHLGDKSLALRVLDRAERHFGGLPTLLHQRAIVHYSFAEYEKALEIWEGVLPEWRWSSTGYYDEGVAPTLGCRTAGISAAALDNWVRASHWFSEGARRAATAMAGHFVAGFEADSVYCDWRAHDYRSLVAAGIRSLCSLEALEEGELDAATKITAKLVGHVLLWIHTVNRGGDCSNLGEPWAGMCSNPEPNEEIGNLRPTPLDLNWIHLCELEDEHLGTSEAYSIARSRLEVTEYPSLRFRVAHLALTKAIRGRDLSGIPAIAQTMANGVELLPAFLSQGGEGILDREQPGARQVEAVGLQFGLDFLAGALLAVDRGDREQIRQIVAEWRERSARLPSADAFRAWLEAAEALLGLGAHELKKIHGDSQAERDTRLLAMVLLALEDALEPELRFAVHCSLVGLFGEGLWKNALGSHLCKHIVEAWRGHAALPATLRAPRVSVPQILSALEDESEGWRKAARVLLAASLAVVSNPPASLREKLVALARGR
jgi:hypothetical protein